MPSDATSRPDTIIEFRGSDVELRDTRFVGVFHKSQPYLGEGLDWSKVLLTALSVDLSFIYAAHAVALLPRVHHEAMSDSRAGGHFRHDRDFMSYCRHSLNHEGNYIDSDGVWGTTLPYDRCLPFEMVI
jgi:hypothetical protein